MATNRAVEHFLHIQELSIGAHGVDDWARPHIDHIDQEASALAGRVYDALTDLEKLQATPDEQARERLNLEMAGIIFRIGAVRDVVEATNITLTKHGKARSEQLNTWVTMLNDAEPVIVQARTSLAPKHEPLA